MANPATTADIEARWRPLTTAETTVATTRLADAWRLLKRLVPDLETRMATDPDLEADAVQALAEAVMVVLRNPEGIRRGTVQVDDASRSYEYDSGDGGGLSFTDAQIAALSGDADSSDARAYSVMPG